MPISASKQELLTSIHSEYAKLRPLLAGIDMKRADEPFLPGQIKDTIMTPKQLASYLLGWSMKIVEWGNIYRQTNKIPEIITSDFGGVAQKFYAKYDDVAYDELLAKLDVAVAEVLKMIEDMTEDELYETAWYTAKSSGRKYTFGRIIQINTASPFRNARGRLQRGMEENS